MNPTHYESISVTWANVLKRPIIEAQQKKKNWIKPIKKYKHKTK